MSTDAIVTKIFPSLSFERKLKHQVIKQTKKHKQTKQKQKETK